MPSHILYFIKAPVRGRVKTRLAATLGETVALELYKNFILDGLEAVKQAGVTFSVYLYPPENTDEATSLLGPSHRLLPQCGNDLGERMKNAFVRCFAEGFDRAILVGSDLPDLPVRILREASSSLVEHDAVIGPASDGGYYLIGFNRHSFLPRVFYGISWGTGSVFQSTLELLRASALTVHLTPEWNDIDTLDDLNALCRRSKSTVDKSRTLMYLGKIGLL